MQLLPEITGSRTYVIVLENCLKGLPSIKREGSYDSVDVYKGHLFSIAPGSLLLGHEKGFLCAKE